MLAKCLIYMGHGTDRRKKQPWDPAPDGLLKRPKCILGQISSGRFVSSLVDSIGVSMFSILVYVFYGYLVCELSLPGVVVRWEVRVCWVDCVGFDNVVRLVDR